MTGRGRLRVGVDARLTRLGSRTGHGRMWHNVIVELEPLVEVVPIDPTTGRRARRAPVDVMLGNGHAFPVDARVPLVVQVHEAAWDDPATKNTVDPAFIDQMVRATAAATAAASAVITPSESTRRDVIDRYGLEPARVRAVLHGVDSTMFRPDRAPAGHARVAAALGSSRPYVMYAGSLHPRKNLPVLREAMAQVINEGRPHALVLAVSASPDRANSADLLAAASVELSCGPGRLAVFTALDDPGIADLMAGSAVLCLPSATEGFGLTVLEAMSSGVAVVAADRGAIPEVLGGTGVLAEPTVTAISGAIGALLDDEPRRIRLAATARGRAATLSWSRTAQQWVEVMRFAAEDPV